MYEALILPPSDATSGTDYVNQVISVSGEVTVVDGDGNRAIYSQPNADGADDTNAEANRANPTKAVVNLDVTPPALVDGYQLGQSHQKLGRHFPRVMN